METTNVIIGILKMHLNFMTLRGYVFQPIAYYTEDNANKTFAKLTMANSGLNKKLLLTIYAGTLTAIDADVTDCSNYRSINLKLYADFKQNNFPRESPSFLIDVTDLNPSANATAKYIRTLIETDLSDVFFDDNWITMPVFDPRDDY